MLAVFFLKVSCIREHVFRTFLYTQAVFQKFSVYKGEQFFSYIIMMNKSFCDETLIMLVLLLDQYANHDITKVITHYIISPGLLLTTLYQKGYYLPHYITKVITHHIISPGLLLTTLYHQGYYSPHITKVITHHIISPGLLLTTFNCIIETVLMSDTIVRNCCTTKAHLNECMFNIFFQLHHGR